MKKLICFLGLFNLLSISLEAQKADSQTLTDSIRSGITLFFTNRGYLDIQKIGNSLDFVYATELLKEHSLGYDINGIYRIGVYQSHTDEFVLIKNGAEFKIYDSKSVNALLADLLEFFISANLDANSMFLYLKSVIGIYEAKQHEQNSQIKK